MIAKSDYPLIRKLYEQGLGDGEIARAIDTKYTSREIRSWRKKSGLPSNLPQGNQGVKKRIDTEGAS